MNNQSPLIPQGSLLEQKNKTRIRVKIAVIFVLALHGIGLLALLMQGCGHENAGTSGSGSSSSNSASAGAPESTASNPAPGFAASSNTAPPEATSSTSTATSPPPATVPATNQAQTPPPTESANLGASTPQSAAGEYKVVKGDTLSKIARKSHVSLQALTAANPGVVSSKLKIDQAIHIPAQTAAAPASSGPGAGTGAVTEGTEGQQVYTVKSNDTLSKIARQFGLKVKAVRAANHLKTDKIRVGQKLTIPAKTAANTEAAPAAPAATGSPSTPAAPSGR
jgi:LysM repeat protein